MESHEICKKGPASGIIGPVDDIVEVIIFLLRLDLGVFIVVFDAAAVHVGVIVRRRVQRTAATRFLSACTGKKRLTTIRTFFALLTVTSINIQ